MIRRIPLYAKQRGVTLVELVTAITIIGIMGTIVVAFGVSSLANYNASYNRGVLLDQAHLGLRGISDSILQSGSADNINRIADINGPGGPTQLFGWQSDGDTLVLATAAEDNNGNILFQDASQYISYKNNIIYYIQNNNLKRRVLAANVTNNKAVTTCPESIATAICPKDATIIENVQSFNVGYFDSQNQAVDPEDARSIELEINLSKTVQGKQISAGYSTRTVFRND